MTEPNLNELKKEIEELRRELWDHLDTVKLIKSDLQIYYKEQLELKNKFEKDLEKRRRIRKFLFSLFQLKCLRKEVKE